MTEKISWESSFYFYGVVGVIWFVFWWMFSYERPAICPSITEQERIYIEESIGESSSLATKMWIKPPWKSFFTSKAVWAIIVANFCRSWSFYLLIIDQAEYFKEALGYNLASVRKNLKNEIFVKFIRIFFFQRPVLLLHYHI